MTLEQWQLIQRYIEARMRLAADPYDDCAAADAEYFELRLKRTMVVTR